jgi:hypothetical protein
MSGESSGWACEVPIEPRDNTQVSIIQLFDMTIPFWRKCSRHRIFDGGRARTKFTARLIARNYASADRHDAGAP